MSGPNKKRQSSFRKIFPNLFTSSKKQKNKNDNDKSFLNTSSDSYKSNRYESPRSVNPRTEDEVGDELIYENLTVSNVQTRDEVQSDSIISISSSSTLVSETAKHKPTDDGRQDDLSYIHYTARPQVPRKPLEHNVTMSPNTSNNIELQYPEVYYHSLEKLTDNDKIFDQIQKYGNNPQVNPESVGAEIKKVSTTVFISPKKEAEVRTIQPTRARSLSFEHKKENLRYNNTENVELISSMSNKPYNYSAPTSPLPINHKTPIMPKTVSPYEHVRKSMNENEEKLNSLNRSSGRNVTPSPKQRGDRSLIAPNMARTEPGIEQTIHKEKTRQKVEAFYWQKLRELKQKEDEYLLQQSINNPSLRSSYQLITGQNLNSTPILYENRTSSLPRGQRISSGGELVSKTLGSPFTRGAPERRTDTYIYNQSRTRADPDIVYRYPLQMDPKNSKKQVIEEKKQMPIFQRGSLTKDTRKTSQQQKRVSFEEKYLKKNDDSENDDVKDVFASTKTADKSYEQINPLSGVIATLKLNSGLKGYSKPPVPPVRTTSVVGVGDKNSETSRTKKLFRALGGNSACSESESGSEAGEIQRILQTDARKENDWHGDGHRVDGGLSDGEAGRGLTRGRSCRRDDARRHTLGDNHQHYILSAHPSQINSLDLEPQNMKSKRGENSIPEYATVDKGRTERACKHLNQKTMKPPGFRGYQQSTLFDDDPGIMSEVETASTGFRRGGKQRSSLPVVRTPSKTLERPLGLVFLQYRNETKRALLPNEITSIDTVKALFVRSFPKQLTMQYMDSPLVKIYIHDSSKDMFYELEDLRPHLRDIRDRSVLRLFESTDLDGGSFPGAVGAGPMAVPPGAVSYSGPSSWDNDQSYFSEPEIDSDYHHQHVHKPKGKPPAYYMGTAAPSTLTRGGNMHRAFSPSAPPLVSADRNQGTSAPSKPLRSYVAGSGSERCFPFSAPDGTRPPDPLYTMPGHSSEGYMSSPERGSARAPYEDPYYTQYMGPSASRQNITSIIDEEASEAMLIDDPYQRYAVNPITTRPMPRPPYDARIAPADEMQRLRVENMERQLANLTGLVQKALQVPGAAAVPTPSPRQEPYVGRSASQDGPRYSSTERPPKLGRDKFQKSVSFEKSVSFSDDPPDMNSPKQHSPLHAADSKPTKPAIKSSTLPRTSSQERDRLKPAPPPKPAGLVGQQLAPIRTYTINVSPEFFKEFRVLQRQSRDLRLETRNLRRSTLSHAMQMRQMMADTIVKIGALAASFFEENPDSQLSREEEVYRQDMLLLENDLYELEATVERLRGQAANRETRVNMADIERIAMVLSKSSKTVADWKIKLPVLHDSMKLKLAADMEKIVRKEKMLEEEPERLELALRRCKKLTGTLVTLKRLACVQEQRLPIAEGRLSPSSSHSSFTAGPSSEEFGSDSTIQCTMNKGGRAAAGRGPDARPENALDALLDELQTFSKPAGAPSVLTEPRGELPLRRLHSYPSGSDTDASPPVRARGQHLPKPPVPERHPELLALAARRAPPPPPPRTTSRSPLASPTSPASPPSDGSRQTLLEQRHQELLKKQRALQEQYARLQMIQRSGSALPPKDLKKTGSESNLLSKLKLNMSAAVTSGSLTHLAADAPDPAAAAPDAANAANACNGSPDETASPHPSEVATINKVYETDIL